MSGGGGAVRSHMSRVMWREARSLVQACESWGNLEMEDVLQGRRLRELLQGVIEWMNHLDLTAQPCLLFHSTSGTASPVRLRLNTVEGARRAAYIIDDRITPYQIELQAPSLTHCTFGGH